MLEKTKLSSFQIIGFVIWIIYVLSLVNPDLWWGAHFVSFLPPILKFGILITSLILILGNDFIARKLEGSISRYFQLSTVKAVFISFGFGFAFYAFKMVSDYYGDAQFFMSNLNSITDLKNQDLFKHLFNYEVWNPKVGEETVLSLVQLIGNSRVEIFNPEFGFSIVTATFGGFFIFSWINLIRKNIENKTLQLILLLAGISSPMLLIFQGHHEIYAPIAWALTWFFLRLTIYNQNATKANVIWLSLAFILCLKFHITSWFLLPILILTLLKEKIKELNFSFALKKVFIPLAILGVSSYFFVFEDYNDNRILNGEIDYSERLFLPILQPDAPLDRYTLLHTNHLTDWINITFIWSPIVLLLLISVIVKFKNIDWNKTESIQGFLAITFYSSFFFMINPLLGMEMDWDLYTIPGFIALASLVLILKNFEKKESLNVAPLTLGFVLFFVPVFVVHQDKSLLSKRLISCGKNSFKGYWINSVTTIKNGVRLINNQTELAIQTLENTALELEPVGIKDNDLEMSRLYQELGIIHRKYQVNLEKAKKYHERAAYFYYNNGDNLMGLLETYFLLKDFTHAHDVAKVLILNSYPNKEKALRMGLHTALEANLPNDAFHYTEELLKINPEDKLIQFINTQIPLGAIPTELAKNFRAK